MLNLIEKTDDDSLWAAHSEAVHYRLLIDGREVPAVFGGTFVSHDPATGAVVAIMARATQIDVEEAVEAARGAFDREWRSTSAAERGRLLQDVGRRLLELIEPLALWETRDCGKTLEQTRSDVRTAARYFEFFGNAAANLLGTQIPVGPARIDFTVRTPFGVSAQINSWNFPLNMAARSIAAALAAGNTVVVKTPELAPVTTAILGRIMTEVGFPRGVVNILHGFGADVGEAISTHPDVDLITFTGSVGTGRRVAANAAQALTPCVLEMGGKSPVLIFPDADLPAVAVQLAAGFVEANGQSCDLPSLALVHRDVHDEFVTLLVERVREFSIAAGTKNPDVSALISESQLNRVAEFVTGAEVAGAQVAIGGQRARGVGLDEGWFFEPTVVTGVGPEMRIARDEVFGPVLAVLKFEDEADALKLANGSDYGLAAFVFTGDLARGMRLSQGINAGQVYVNCFSSGDSPMVPFGGFKGSGYGREKGLEALHTYSQVKNVCIATE